MRLARVREITENGQYPFQRFTRSGWPEGETSHWGLPLDGVLIAGSWLLRPVIHDADRALYWVGFWLGPLLFLGTLGVWVVAARRVGGRDAAWAMAMLLPLQQGVINYYFPARPDHHALLHLTASAVVTGFFGWQLGVWKRVRGGAFACGGDGRFPAVLGGGVALTLWISVESAVLAAILGAWLGCLTVAGPTEGRTRAMAWLRDYAGWVAVGCFVATVVERGQGVARSWELDSISLRYVLGFGWVWLWAAALEPRWTALGAKRAVATLMAVAVCGVAVFLIGPRILAGVPSGVAELGFMAQFLDRASGDGMPVWASVTPFGETVCLWFGVPLVVAPFGAATWWGWGAVPRLVKLLAISLALAYVALAFDRLRWNVYASTGTAFFAALAVRAGLRRWRFAARMGGWRTGAMRSAAAAGLAILAGLAGRGVPAVVGLPQGDRFTGTKSLESALPELEAMWAADRVERGLEGNRRVWTHVALGGALVYQWRAKVLGTPNVRNARAVRRHFDVFLGMPADAALDELRREGWPYLLVADRTDIIENVLYRKLVGVADLHGKETLADRACAAGWHGSDGLRLVGETSCGEGGVRLRLIAIEY